MASTELSIRNACVLGREEECRKAEYVERSSLVAGLGLGGLGGSVGGVLGPIACVAVGIPTGGTATFACVVLGVRLEVLLAVSLVRYWEKEWGRFCMRQCDE